MANTPHVNGAPRKRIVFKIGSSLLVDSRGGLSIERLNGHAAALLAVRAAGHELLLVSSGAVAAGFRALGYSSRPRAVAGKQACAAVGQGLLMQAYADAFGREGVTVAQVLLTRGDFSNRESYHNALTTFSLLLEHGALPVINENDSVATGEITFGDNDILSALVAALLHADLLVILTDIDGLYDANPNERPNAKRIPRVEELSPELLTAAGSTGSKVGTGGMLAKLKAAEYALGLGVEVFIGDGRDNNAEKMLAVLQGKGAGTYIGSPARMRLKRKKQWIAFHSECAGRVYVDSGAERALLDEGKSLLPVGVKRSEGAFDRGDVVEVWNTSGTLLGRGVTAISASDLTRVLGKPAPEVKKILARAKTEFIHRDNWVSLLVRGTS